MITVQFSLSQNKYMEPTPDFHDLGRLFVRSYKAEKNRNTIS